MKLFFIFLFFNNYYIFAQNDLIIKDAIKLRKYINWIDSTSPFNTNENYYVYLQTNKYQIIISPILSTDSKGRIDSTTNTVINYEELYSIKRNFFISILNEKDGLSFGQNSFFSFKNNNIDSNFKNLYDSKSINNLLDLIKKYKSKIKKENENIVVVNTNIEANAKKNIPRTIINYTFITQKYIFFLA